MPLNAFTTHRPSNKVYHRGILFDGSQWRRYQTWYRRAFAFTTGHWGSGHSTLALSCRRCRTVSYTSSDTSRFINRLLSPRPFRSRLVVRLGVIYLERRPPPVAIPSVRTTAHNSIIVFTFLEPHRTTKNSFNNQGRELENHSFAR